MRVVLEDPVTIKPVVGGDETTPGNRTDHIDLVEHALLSAIHHEPGIPELLENAIGKGGCAGAASREGNGQAHLAGALTRATAGDLRIVSRRYLGDRCIADMGRRGASRKCQYQQQCQMLTRDIS